MQMSGKKGYFVLTDITGSDTNISKAILIKIKTGSRSLRPEPVIPLTDETRPVANRYFYLFLAESEDSLLVFFGSCRQYIETIEISRR